MLKRTAKMILLAMALLLPCGAASAEDAPRPNIVFIMADDLGWMDTGVYGSDFYETPNIDALAARGMRFTNAYSASPLCSPTRASVLTGQYPGRLGITAPHGHLPEVVLKASAQRSGSPAYRATANQSVSRLQNSYDNYAKDLGEAGYATGFFGKWHLGFDPYIPENQGFETVVGGGGYPGPRSFFSPYNMPEVPDGPRGEHIDDRMTAEAIGFMREAAESGKPFLVNYWAWDVHAPFQGKEDLIAKYQAKLDKNSNSKQMSPTMGAMVETLDQNVGALLAEVDRLGLTENTLVVFFSDNGGNMYNEVDGGVTPTNNAPLKNGKGNIYEGGIRVPFIAAWPNHIAEGAVSDALVCSIDLYPTFLDLLDLDRPADHVIDGISLKPVLLEQASLDRNSIVIDFPHNVVATENRAAISVRQGDMKLIRYYWDLDVGSGSPAHRYELYNLSDDIGESKNLAADHLYEVRAMDAIIEAYLMETGAVVPLPNPNFGKAAAASGQPGGEREAVGGWVPGGTSDVTIEDDALVVASKGTDPYISTREGLPEAKGELELRFTMDSDIVGFTQVFWTFGPKRAFGADRSEQFDPEPKGEAHEYSVSFKVPSNITGLRIDPGRGKGTAKITSISLHDANGKELKRWTF